MRSLLILTLVTVAIVSAGENARASAPATAATQSPVKAAATQPATASAAAPTETSKSEGTPKKAGSVLAPSQQRPAGGASSQPGPTPVAKTTTADAQAPREETLEEIVARVRRRLAQERSPRKNGPAPAPVKASDRVMLVWRPYVVWPEELTGGRPEATSSDSERVTLKWNSDAQ